jgi:hypothetical protein
MSTWHGYFALEILNLTDPQRDTLVDAIRSLVHSTRSRFPQYDLNVRVRPDGDAAIFEAAFNEDNLTVSWFKDRLAAVFEIDPATIDHRTSQTQYGPVVVFERPSGTDRIRVALFGGVGADWEDSRRACVAYLSDNAAEWESGE